MNRCRVLNLRSLYSATTPPNRKPIGRNCQMTFFAVLRKMDRCSVFDLLEITRDSEWNALNSQANDEPFGYLAGNPGSRNICAVLDRMQKGCHRRHSIHVPDASRSRHERTGQMSQVWHG